MSHSSQTNSLLRPKYLTARVAADIYGVHKDFFRKQPELRRSRVVLNSKTHVYPIAVLDRFFADRVLK